MAGIVNDQPLKGISSYELSRNGRMKAAIASQEMIKVFIHIRRIKRLLLARSSSSVDPSIVLSLPLFSRYHLRRRHLHHHQYLYSSLVGLLLKWRHAPDGSV